MSYRVLSRTEIAQEHSNQLRSMSKVLESSEAEVDMLKAVSKIWTSEALIKFVKKMPGSEAIISYDNQEATRTALLGLVSQVTSGETNLREDSEQLDKMLQFCRDSKFGNVVGKAILINLYNSRKKK